MSDEEKALEDEILADAERRAERRRKQAEREADTILSEAREEAEQERRRALLKARMRAESEQARLRARTEQEVASVRRGAVQQILLEHVQAQARRGLAQLPERPDYRAVLVSLALRAIEAMDGEEFRIVLRGPDREKWGQRLVWEVPAAARRELEREVKVELADEDINCSGGPLLRAAGGRQVADQTFEARMDRLWKQMRDAVIDILPTLSGADR